MLARDFLQVLTVRFIPPVPIATRKNRKSSSLGGDFIGPQDAGCCWHAGRVKWIRRHHPPRSRQRVDKARPSRHADSPVVFFCLFVSSPPTHLAVGRSPFHVTVRRQKNEDVTNNRPRMGSLTSSNSSRGAGATPHDAFQGPAWEKKKDAAASRRVRLGALQSTKDASGCVSSRGCRTRRG